MPLFICRFCASERKNIISLRSHECTCPSNLNRNYKNGMTGKKGTNQYLKADKLGLPRPITTEATRNKIIEALTGRKHSQESKDKISRARLKYLTENPDKVPYLLNHYSKGPSYPEKYWKEIFDKYGVKYTEQYRIHLYQLDFALIEEKIDIEIDGNQHYSNEKAIKRDIRRDEYLENLGWKIIRIKWSDYKKLVDKKDRINYVKSIIDKIQTNTNS